MNLSFLNVSNIGSIYQNASAGANQQLCIRYDLVTYDFLKEYVRTDITIQAMSRSYWFLVVFSFCFIALLYSIFKNKKVFENLNLFQEIMIFVMIMINIGLMAMLTILNSLDELKIHLLVIYLSVFMPLLYLFIQYALNPFKRFLKVRGKNKNGKD